MLDARNVPSDAFFSSFHFNLGFRGSWYSEYITGVGTGIRIHHALQHFHLLRQPPMVSSMILQTSLLQMPDRLRQWFSAAPKPLLTAEKESL